MFIHKIAFIEVIIKLILVKILKWTGNHQVPIKKAPSIDKLVIIKETERCSVKQKMALKNGAIFVYPLMMKLPLMLWTYTNINSWWKGGLSIHSWEDMQKAILRTGVLGSKMWSFM